MTNDRPEDDGNMFFVGMKFKPTETLSQKDLNQLVVHLLRRVFVTPDGDPLPVKDHDNAMLMLVQFLVDLDIMLTEEAFDDIPDALKRYFVVHHRDGSSHRYGHRPMW